MDILAQILFTVIYAWIISLIFIGPWQVIAALIRAAHLKDWNSEFGIRLKKYFLMLVAFWVAAGICILIQEYGFDIGWMFFLFVPVLSTTIAIYYWRAVYLIYKSKKSETLS